MGDLRPRPAAFTTSELNKFLSELHPLFETLNGSVEFSTMEGQLSLRLVGDGKGHIELHGVVADQPGVGNRLHFTLQFDQSQLGVSIGELKKVISTFIPPAKMLQAIQTLLGDKFVLPKPIPQ